MTLMYTGFTAMVKEISRPESNFKTRAVCQTDYSSWQHEFVFDALQGLRYGQSFCNHFDLTDHILFYEQDPEWADMYIRSYYVV